MIHRMALILLLLPLSAAEAARFSLVGVGDSSRYEAESGAGAEARVGFGGGALLEFSLGRWVSVETGALYLQRRIGLPGGDYGLPSLEVPVLLRAWLGRVITVGAGAFVHSGFGDVRSPTGATVSYGSLGLRPFDAGLIGVAGLNVPIATSLGLLAEARYLRGLTPAGPAGDARWKGIQAIIGLRLGAVSGRR